MKHVYGLWIFSMALMHDAAAQMKNDSLPEPYATKSVMNFSHVIGWENNTRPIAADGFKVSLYADGFDNPRWIYVAPNGDILIAESNTNHGALEKIGAHVVGASKSNDLDKSADRITILTHADGDDAAFKKDTLLTGLNQPFGMLILGDWLYVGNTDALVRFPYKAGVTKITAKPEKLVDLPAGKHNRHWARNIISNKDDSRIYIAVGSGSNVAEDGMENEILRADILEIKPDGSDLKVYASGLRNPCGMAWAPGTNILWTVVNERDELGDNLVPDYFTSVKKDGFYGWPYAYFGGHLDPRVKDGKPALVSKTIVPDVSLGSHTASLGLVFYKGKQFPEKYRNGAFISQHGSWNRSVLAGYKVVFVPFREGKPSAPPEDFLTGFIADLEKGIVRGRPVGLAELPDGSLLMADDVNNVIWRIAYVGNR